ncbi:hypothetical protein E5K00_04255 [Hymenobacter aquaticus]|uniref:Uncharacterized protein n=1 Tax=Hymenobacter aquaticus TaxID=1867101 RepID=A0A4Z0Q4A7_9BACT|nr:hypothetical protein [Hymenobacter aquaticus]TGE24434.1 hypothetical protein E5K00_04255 [Hymenobacter aquaticus]
MSQLTLSKYLGIGREQLAYAELGTRPLPRVALLPLSRLVQALPAEALSPLAAGEAAANGGPLPELPAPAALVQRQQECLREAGQLRTELARLQIRANQSAARLVLATALRAAPPPPPAGSLQEPEAVWLGRLTRQAVAQLAAGGATAQALLGLRIRALEYEADEAHKLAVIYLQ